MGTQISDRYVTEAVLGEGGMGTVYAGRDLLRSRPVAIKTIKAGSSPDGDSDSNVRRFLREAQACARIEHAHVVSFYDFGLTRAGDFYLVMEHVNGVSLSAALRFGRLDAQRAVRIAVQVARGLGAAHAFGIVHRDVKAQNVLLVDAGTVHESAKVIDFGLAKPTGNTLDGVTVHGQIAGTPDAMAPEQIAPNGVVDARTDIYALGCLLYRMLTGKHPFVGADPIQILVQHVSSRPPPFSVACPGMQLSPSLEALVMRCLEKDKELRFDSMDQLADALERVDLTSSSVGPAPPLGGAEVGLTAVELSSIGYASAELLPSSPGGSSASAVTPPTTSTPPMAAPPPSDLQETRRLRLLGAALPADPALADSTIPSPAAESPVPALSSLSGAHVQVSTTLPSTPAPALSDTIVTPRYPPSPLGVTTPARDLGTRKGIVTLAAGAILVLLGALVVVMLQRATGEGPLPPLVRDTPPAISTIQTAPNPQPPPPAAPLVQPPVSVPSAPASTPVLAQPPPVATTRTDAPMKEPARAPAVPAARPGSPKTPPKVPPKAPPRILEDDALVPR